MQELYIDTQDDLLAFCDAIRGSSWLALDTEFVREKTYYPEFCLLQISNGQLAACVDPLALEQMDPLLEIIYSPAVVKVFHAGRQDLEIFHHLWQRLPAPLFDTQLAASLLGLGDQVGYANLVQSVLNHQLEKGHARTDWSLRPLEQAQLRYALDDVIYLGDLYLRLKKELDKLHRSNWLNEDFAMLADPATYQADPANQWQRIKGRKHLRGNQLAVLQALTAWREETSRALNRPKRWVMKDEVLVDLSRRQPDSLAKAGRIRGLEASALKRHGNTLLQLIADAKALPRDAWPSDKAIPPRLNPNQDALADLLMAALRLIADHNEITPSALASRKDLERLITGERELELLHGWRRSLAGETLLGVLEGELSLGIKSGVVELEGLAEAD